MESASVLLLLYCGKRRIARRFLWKNAGEKCSYSARKYAFIRCRKSHPKVAVLRLMRYEEKQPSPDFAVQSLNTVKMKRADVCSICPLCHVDDISTFDSRRGKRFCLAFIILWQAQDCKEILAGKRAYALSAQRSTSTPEVVPSAAYCGVTLQPRASPRKRSGTMVRLSLLMYGAASMVCGVPLTV